MTDKRTNPINRLRCQRCARRFRLTLPDVDAWNATVRGGVVVAVLCPSCQTPEENAEAEVNYSTTDYGATPDGRLLGWPKGQGPR